RPGGLGSAPGDTLEAAALDLIRGAREEQIFTDVLNSNGDYVTADRQGSWIRALYQDILQRTPGPDETAYWLGRLEGGMTEGLLADTLTHSHEYNVLLVQNYYLNILHRPTAPPASDIAVWVNQLDNGALRENVILGLVTSDE